MINISQLFISYFALGVAILTTFFAFKYSAKWYWMSTLGMYISSYYGLGLGIYYFNLTFVLLALAVAHSLGLIKSLLHSVITVLLGLVVWMIIVSNVEHDLLFFPITWIIQNF